MALKVYYSDRIEDLAFHLKNGLREDLTQASSDPFAFSAVAVPNTNIAKWLQIKNFAKEEKLCAGIRFPFIEQHLWQLMAENLPEGRRVLPQEKHGYATAILSLLLDNDLPPEEDAALQPLRAYLKGENEDENAGIATRKQARMGWQLARKMADLMDQYEVRRPEIVSAWLAGRPHDAKEQTNEIAQAEGALARALWGPEGCYPPDGTFLSLRQLYDAVCGAPPKGPKRKIYFFGHSTLSCLQAKILVWLAETHDVIFYHNNVCLEYWGDIESRQEKMKRLSHQAERREFLGLAQAEKEDIEIENPLLQEWGVAGRETIRLLVTLEEENDGRIDFEWTCIARERPEPASLLGHLQKSICRRTGALGALAQDASLQIVGVPGLRREVEMVYNAILGAVWQPENSGERPWRVCGFSDIAVLVPDMALYRPYIESVFDARGQIPYGLIDTTAAAESDYLSGFLALGELGRSGLTRATLFALLENPCVREKWSYSPHDLVAWRALTKEIGAFDGFEAEGDGAFFSWEWALSRLRLSRVATALCLPGETEGVIELPEEKGPAAFVFSEIVERLYREVRDAFGEKGCRRAMTAENAAPGADPGENWATRLMALADAVMAVPADRPLERTVRRKIAETLAGLSSVRGEQPVDVALAAVEQLVGGLGCSRGGYLTQGVTIAALQPLRPVPFRQIFVLGLGSHGFPGKVSSSTLDVRGAGWRLGDTTLPKVNRYLFLEMLMSARERLVLSYQNLDIEKNAELFASGIVSELKAFADTLLETGAFEEVKDFPLLERGEGEVLKDIAWRRDDPFAGIKETYSPVMRRMSRRESRPVLPAARETERPAVAEEREKTCELTARTLAEFLLSPLRAVLRHRLGIAVEGFCDNDLPTDVPLEIETGPQMWNIQETVLAGAPVEGLFDRMMREGRLPQGFLGAFAREKARPVVTPEIAASIARAGPREKAAGFFCPRLTRVVHVEGEGAWRVTLTGEIEHWAATQSGLVFLTPGRFDEKDLESGCPPARMLAPFLAFLVDLAGCAAAAEKTLEVVLVDLENGRAATWQWRLAQRVAAGALDRLVSAYLRYPAAESYGMISYRDFVKVAGRNPESWEAVREALADVQEEAPRAKATFDSNLVVAEAVSAYGRAMTAEEICAWVDLLEPFFSGRRAAS